MEKAAEAYRSIGEAARLVGVATHVLRYWESQFPQLKPLRRPDGRRYYRPDDVRLAAGLAAVLREDGLTTRGAARLIARDGGAALRARGAARLPEVFALPAPEAPSAPQPARSADSPPSEPAPEAASPAAAAAPRAPARRRKPAPLPLFPEAAPDPEAATRPAPAQPLARLSGLAARLHGTETLPDTPDLAEAIGHLRRHLARRD